MALEFNMDATIAKKFEMKRDGIHKILCFAGGAAQFKRATISAPSLLRTAKKVFLFANISSSGRAGSTS